MEQAASLPLLRRLGWWSALALVIGSVIGSGIFKKSSVMAAQLGSAELLLLAWAVAGLMTLLGVLTNAEIASMLPYTGGQYVFFRAMYGDFFAYLYGWAMVSVVQTGSIASIAYVFAEHTQYFIPLPRFPAAVEHRLAAWLPGIGTIYPLENAGVKLLTIAAIVVLTAINYRGVHLGGGVQVVLTALKVAAILMLVAMGLSALAEGFGMPHGGTSAALSPPNSSWGLIGAFATALAGAFWAYDGWNNITYVAGEIRAAERTIPRALVVGMLMVTGIYLLVNVSYVSALPIEVLARSELVGVEAAGAVLGSAGAAFVAAAVMLSTLGTTNGTILSSARLFYAMAAQGRLPALFGRVHPRYHTPSGALLLQALWASLLVISGTFDILTDMLIVVSWGFYAAGAAGIFVLRRKFPEAPRPWRVPGYPFVPLAFTMFAAAFVVLNLTEDLQAYARGEIPLMRTVLGLVLVAAGVPIYFVLRRRDARQAHLSSSSLRSPQ
ncbi:Serine/threonine exchanger SteT [bacterium HR21]|nr:Serine/threonine exchanger SteT [bacterium HR21]